MADALENMLNNHDFVCKSTDLPLFFGRKDKYVILPHVLLDRINRAAVIANWATNEGKITEFYMILHDRALIWWESLDNCHNMDTAVWGNVQREFLAAYASRFTARTTCTNFQDLVDCTNETVHDYYLRVAEAFKKMCEAKPDTITIVRANAGNATAAQAAPVKKEGVTDSQHFFMYQFFIAGLKNELRTKIMEAGKTSIQESITLARELQIILNDCNDTSTVSKIKKEPDNNLDDEDLKIINAVRFQCGKPPLQNFCLPAQPQQGQPCPLQQLAGFAK
jgi:hypothetical protein